MRELTLKLKNMKIWGIHKTYPTMSWWENFMGGHLSLGRVTIFGNNAMLWVVTIHTKKWGSICFTLPSIARYRSKMGWYFYLSPNGTPWASTYYIGFSNREGAKAKIRKYHFGHGFDCWDEKTSKELHKLNEEMDSMFYLDYLMTRNPSITDETL